MKVAKVDWPRLDLYPLHGLVRTIDAIRVELYDGRLLRFPPSICSDGASVPNILFPVLDCSGTKLLGPGLVHDACYRIDARWADGKEIERPEADDVLRALALFIGVSELDAAKLRYGVGVGAASSFHKLRLGWVP